MSDELLVSAEGGVGRIRLNRPRAINALTLGMCSGMIEALAVWREDPSIRLVLLDHAESRGFCAGGDIRAVWESAREDGDYARRFFHEEYRLNHLLFTCAKPTIAFLDGVTMGGGVGIGLPCRYRIATERTMFAMPETGIGLFPDVGGGWYLSRLPDRIGHYLALTGARLDGADCVALGLATHFVPADALDALKTELLAAPDEVEALLAEASVAPPPAAIERQRDDIARLFAADRYEELLAALDADGGAWAREQRATLDTKSPHACKVALKLLLEGAGMATFEDEMRQEYAVVAHVCQRHDFLEGVRALLVDKDRAPRWDPATPEGVTDTVIDRIFAPLSADEEWTPLGG